MRAIARCFLLFALVAVVPRVVAAQATLAGEVKDTTGAVLPGVTVTVKYVPTARAQDFSTNADGLYTAPLLQPGEYEVTFALSGFQTRTVKGIQLHVNDRLEVNAQMGVSGVNESVEVSAASQFVQPTPQVQTLMGPTQVQELPLNNRNFAQLATLVPGVSNDLPDEVGIGLTSSISISVNGGRRNAVNWLVDGVQNVDVGSNITLLSTPTLESIQEFKIITSSYAAEWPRSGGGVVNVVTKGGSQHFTGSAYDFLRNDKLNANSFFRNRSTDPATRAHPAPLRYQNPGYTVGGPILPSRKKAFFFWSEEWRRISRAGSTTGNTVNPAWLNDPTNANYVAPELRDPAAVKMLSLWPAPNQFTNGVAQFLNSTPAINNTRQEVIRVDYDLSSQHHLVSRYTHDLSQTREPGGLFFGVAVPNVAATNTNVPGNVFATELRSSVGNGLNEVKYQLSGNQIVTSDWSQNTNTKSAVGVSIPELFPENNAGRIPTIVLGGGQLATVGAIQGYNVRYWDHTITDTFTLQHGKHAYKAGILAAFEQKNENASNETQGRFTFAAAGGRTAFQNLITGNRDGLCGTPCTYAESQFDVTEHLRWHRYEAFAQDTWRARPNVTVDYGIRYVLYPGITDKNNVLSTFDPSKFSLATAPTCSSASCASVIPNTGDPLDGVVVANINSPFGRAVYPTEKTDVQPRVGVSWNPMGSSGTIVRSAYGVYYDQPLVGIFEQNSFSNPPYANTVTVLNPALTNPLAGTAPGTVGVRSLTATDPNFKNPRLQQWNVGMQRQLYRQGAIDVSYVGSHGDRLIQPVDINQPQPQAVVANGGNINAARPYLGYGSISMRQTTAYSNYWGILTQFRHEGGRAGTYTVNYTLSRNRTTASNDRDSVDQPQNPLDLKAEYADARTDRRHVFNATYIYELPFYRDGGNALLKAAAGGWQLSGITVLESGPPVPRILVNTNGGRRGNQATVVGTPTIVNQFPIWFDASAFAPNADGTYGNSGRAPLRLPGRNQTDLALSKNFYPMEKRVQFRADFINAFNHTQWTTVNADCSAAASVTATTCASFSGSTVGQITGTRNPREIQLSLKLYW